MPLTSQQLSQMDQVSGLSPEKVSQMDSVLQGGSVPDTSQTEQDNNTNYPGSKFVEKIPYATAGLAAIPGLLMGPAAPVAVPALGTGGFMGGTVIKDILKNTIKKSTGNKPTSRQQVRERASADLSNVSGQALNTEILLSLIGLSSAASQSKTFKDMINIIKSPKKAVVGQKNKAIDKSTTIYSKEEILKGLEKWDAEQALTPGGEAERRKIMASAKELYASGNVGVGGLSSMKSTAWDKAYTPYGLKKTTGAKANTVIGATAKNLISKKDKAIASWDKLYSLLKKAENIPKALLRGTATAAILNKIGIRF